MNEAIACIEDTIRRLVEEAKQANEAARTVRHSASETTVFDVSRAETLAQVLHTWSNQLRTFGLDTQMNGVWIELQEFLDSQGYVP